MGQILVHEEPHDIFVARYVGDISGADIVRLTEELRRRMVGKPHAFLLGDFHRMGRTTTDARSAGAEMLRALHLRGSAMIGASFHIRAIATLVFKAVELLNKPLDHPMRFFDTEAEGMAWLVERSRELAPPLPRPSDRPSGL
jgi:hypothetical protein